MSDSRKTNDSRKTSNESSPMRNQVVKVQERNLSIVTLKILCSECIIMMRENMVIRY